MLNHTKSASLVAWLIVCLPAVSTYGVDRSSIVAWWRFDEETREAAQDSVTAQNDAVVGRGSRVPGVSGSALCLDGFTTRVVRNADEAPDLASGFTIEAWIAVRAYPWGWCPIASQRVGQEAGWFLGVDAGGHLGLQAAVDGKWTICTSASRLPTLKWMHVCGSFDSESGLFLHVNGEPVGVTNCSGPLRVAEDVDMLLGRNHVPEPAMFETNQLRVHYSLDGLLDEVKIHNRPLSHGDIRMAYSRSLPVDAPPLTHSRLPSGPPSEGLFGAFYERLEYHPAWDAQWRGSGPDVVVAFDKGPFRFVCWRGISYAPCWITEKGNWFTNEFMERGVDRANRGCTESMSDKRAEFSHAKILENNDARAVVYWRHSPVDIYYQKPFVDEETGWGDWAEEYHTIYPDGVAVRRVVMYSNDFKQWHEWCQSIEPLHPGQRPEDVLDARRIVSLANMDGEARDYGWPEGAKAYKHPTFSGASIQITFLRSKFNPFLILDDRHGINDVGGQGPAITLVGGEGWSEYSPFPWRNHWPVTQVPIIGRHAVAADRPSHTYTATQHSAAYATSDHSMTKVMLCGMTEYQKAAKLLPLARSWLRAPQAQCLSKSWRLDEYDMTERAYLVDAIDGKERDSLILQFDATDSSPLVNPAIVVKGWGRRPGNLKIDDRIVPEGPKFRCGYRRALSTTDLIVWLELQATHVTRVEMTAAP